jgi:chromosome segregation ATPase
MADVGLKIVVGADISAVTSELKVASSNVAQFGEAASKAFDEVAASAGALERLNEFIDKLGAEALGAGQAMEQAFQEPIKSIAQLEAEIESLEKELSTATDFATLKRLNDQIKVTQSQLNNLKVLGFESTLGKINPAATSAANGLGKVKDSSKAAGAALTDINRVIQDSAFGFVGIQNNITQLPQSFRALSAAAKESGQSVGKVLLYTVL